MSKRTGLAGTPTRLTEFLTFSKLSDVGAVKKKLQPFIEISLLFLTTRELFYSLEVDGSTFFANYVDYNQAKDLEVTPAFRNSTANWQM